MKFARTTTRCMTALSLAAVVGVGSIASVSLADDMKGDVTKHNDTMMTPDPAKKGDIIDIATGSGMERVTTLVAAVKAAGLVEALKGEGPFTVFAPTNEAFAKLPAGTVEELLKPENKEKLTAILLYHVHKGEAIKAADVKTGALSTLNGQSLDIKASADGVTVNDAKVIKTDVIASNGIIHWVDTVILPK